MAMANLYGFAKLAWNPNLTTDQILDTWTRLTWGNNPTVIATIDELQRHSWHVYEQYTGNLGIGTLTNILGYHYGPGIESAERNGWGQWFRGDAQGIGMDPHRCHRHRLHRPVPTRARQGLRRRQHLPRRPPPLHASRPLHPRPPRRQNRSPVRLRRPLRRRSHRANLSRTLANSQRSNRRRALSGNPQALHLSSWTRYRLARTPSPNGSRKNPASPTSKAA